LGEIQITVSDSNNSDFFNSRSGDASVRRLDLNTAEKEILLKACRMYRASIPSYLKSKQAEIKMMDNIIEILT